ncbi:MAG: DEAD/DEAH box helicase [Verrucomicrobiota bacterium]
MEKRPFIDLGLSPAALKAVEKLGFEEASPIQTASIPILLKGLDLVGQSQTGSGKTAAFVLPALDQIDHDGKYPQLLILCPARELAMQVAEEVHKLAAFMPKIHAVPIYGGASYERQFYELKRGPQVVIGTPGRVMDMMDRRALDLSRIKMVVLDECDRMLDMGFRDDMEKILGAAPAERQTVFFSATMPAVIRDLIGRYSRDVQHIRIASKDVTVPTVDQAFFEVPIRNKPDALTRLIDMQNARLGIIFCNTQRMVDELTDMLQGRGYSADRLHGGITQAMRSRTIEKFRKSGFDLLVATDVAGRGLDVEEVDLVVNFDLPWDPEDYVHRVGRTGRAGRKGTAFTLVSGREIYKLQAIERFTRSRIRRGNVPTLDEVEQKRAGSVVDKIRERLVTGRFKPQDGLVEQLLEEGHSSTDVASALFHELLAASGFEPDLNLHNNPSGPRPAAPAPVAKKPEPAAKKAPPAAPSEPVAAKPAPAAPLKPAPVKAAPAPAAVPAPEIADDAPTEVVPQVRNAVPAPAEPDFERESDAAPAPAVESAPAPAPAVKPAKAAAAKPAPKPVLEPLEDDSENEIRFENDFESDPPVRETRNPGEAAGKTFKMPPQHEMITLPAAARGFQWVRVGVGKNQGFGPREIVDLLADGALNFPPQAVGQIKLMEEQSFCQIHSSHSKSLVADMEGAEHEGRPLKVTFAARGPTSGYGEGGEGRPPRFGGRGSGKPGFRHDGPPPRSDAGKPPWKKK